MKISSATLTALVILTVGTVTPSIAAPAGNIGETQECIRLRDIGETPTIDERTILVKMNSGQFKRIDLLNACPDLAFSGFAHTTHDDQLCRSDPLTVRDHGGLTCKIDKITTIDRDEAMELESKRR